METIKKLQKHITTLSGDKETTYDEFEILSKLNALIHKELELWEQKESKNWNNILKD